MCRAPTWRGEPGLPWLGCCSQVAFPSRGGQCLHPQSPPFPTARVWPSTHAEKGCRTKAGLCCPQSRVPSAPGTDKSPSGSEPQSPLPATGRQFRPTPPSQIAPRHLQCEEGAQERGVLAHHHDVAHEGDVRLHPLLDGVGVDLLP